ncbi:MAG TPA: chorismate mutase [Gemmatimonadaceae bacterium]|nr:chorismate mutase [Gemmatimonadaceae bacterium]
MVTHPSLLCEPATARPVRAIRGAITVAADDAALVRQATIELLQAMLAHNDLQPAQLVSAIFTVTPDLTSEFPARAARELGWREVPMLCAQEVAVPGALPRCLRVLLHAETGRPRALVRHVYLRDAVALRPDLAPEGPDITGGEGVRSLLDSAAAAWPEER